MKNKFLSKTVNKSLLFSIIVAVLLVASIVVSLVFGVNYNVKTDDATTLTVQMNSFFYNNDLDSLEDTCKAEFKNQGLQVEYTYYDTRTTGGDTCEVVYVFTGADGVADKVQTAKTNLKATIATNTADGGIWHGATGMYVTTGSEIVKTNIPTSQTVRATVMAVIFSLVAGVYVAIRYGIKKGIVAFLAPIVGMILTTSLILLVRIPFTSAVFYAVAVSGLISEVFTVFTLFKMRGNETDTGETLVINSVALTEILTFAVVLGVAIILVGSIATWIVRWFAVSALIALIVAINVGLYFAPALLTVAQKSDDKNAESKTSSGYVGAKKQDEKAEQTEQE